MALGYVCVLGTGLGVGGPMGGGVPISWSVNLSFLRSVSWSRCVCWGPSRAGWSCYEQCYRLVCVATGLDQHESTVRHPHSVGSWEPSCHALCGARKGLEEQEI